MDDELRARARAWRDADPDPGTRAEVDALFDADDLEGLADRFGTSLTFGTAGLRGELGAGPNRMNRLVVRRAAAGLLGVLPPGARVVIGWDARDRSDAFAVDTARVIAAAGGQPLLLPRALPTPVLAFAVRHLGADAGVMVTASHNPPGDNGYKVFGADGAQIVAPVDEEIAAAISRVAPDEVVPLADEDDPAIVQLSNDVVDAYLEVAATVVEPNGPRDVTIAYTALHGVGGTLAVAAFGRAGFERVHVVSSQHDPDGRFPTVAFPNPEEPGALDLVEALAREVDADLVLAHDPDADRLGVMVPRDGDWIALSGDQIGALLADELLARGDGPDRLVVTTLVSSRLLARIADHHGVVYVETLTGFKWIMRAAIERPELRFVFGYEEALGFAVDDTVRDKDGITAALVVAELVAGLAARGRTVWDRLAEIDEQYGHHATATKVIRFAGSRTAAGAAAGAAMARLRRHPPFSFGGRTVEGVVDYAAGAPGLPSADALAFHLVDGGRVVVRPSGTEPTLKAYVETLDDTAPGLAEQVGREISGP